MSSSNLGKFQVGDKVILGKHQPIDINGNPCDPNWVPQMDVYVGTVATIIKSLGISRDGSGSPSYRVYGNCWMWRGINMTPYQSNTTTTAPTHGIKCSKCGDFNQYATANQKDGSFVCYGCRH